MSAHPYQDAAGVLDAAAAGTTVPGFEGVGKLLVDLSRTAPLGPGVALRSSAVVGAAKASRRVTRFAALRSRVPIIVVSAMVLAGVTLLATRGSSPDPVTDLVGDNAPGAETGNTRLVTDDRANDDADVDNAGTDDVLGVGNASRVASPTTTGEVEGADTAGAAPSVTAQPVATTTAEGPPTTANPPATSTGEQESPVEAGNNGNDSGNGIGNGKGNQGSGGSSGDGGNLGVEKSNRGSD